LPGIASHPGLLRYQQRGDGQRDRQREHYHKVEFRFHNQTLLIHAPRMAEFRQENLGNTWKFSEGEKNPCSGRRLSVVLQRWLENRFAAFNSTRCGWGQPRSEGGSGANCRFVGLALCFRGAAICCRAGAAFVFDDRGAGFPRADRIDRGFATTAMVFPGQDCRVW
jgi:hypothetical protein